MAVSLFSFSFSVTSLPFLRSTSVPPRGWERQDNGVTLQDTALHGDFQKTQDLQEKIKLRIHLFAIRKGSIICHHL